MLGVEQESCRCTAYSLIFISQEREKYWPKVKNGYVTQPKDDDPFLWHLYVKAPVR